MHYYALCIMHYALCTANFAVCRWPGVCLFVQHHRTYGIGPLELSLEFIVMQCKDMNASCMHHAYIMHASCMHAYFHASMQVAYGSSETVLSTYRSMFYVFLGSQNGQKPRTTFSQILSFTKMGKTLSIISNTRLFLVLPHMFL